MPRALMLTLLLSLSANASADCDLRFAPAEVRAAAWAFHHSTGEPRPGPTDHPLHAAVQTTPRMQQGTRHAPTPKLDNPRARDAI
jgi:hypothetical protein